MDEERRSQPEGEQPPPPPPSETAVAAPEPPAPPPKTSGLAIASLVVSLLGAVTCVGILIAGPIAVVLGLMALKQIGADPERVTGRGLAIAGTIIGAVGFLIAAILTAVLIPVMLRAQAQARKSQCLNNVKQLSMAMMMYTADWDDSYPSSAAWNDTLMPYMRNSKILICPSEKSGQTSYAMNRNLSEIWGADIPSFADTVTLFESTPGENQAGGRELLPSPPRHDDMHVMGFADGHVKAVSADEAAGFIWDPYTDQIPEPSSFPEGSEEEPAPSG